MKETYIFTWGGVSDVSHLRVVIPLCVAVCCSLLQCDTVCCSVLQCELQDVALCCKLHITLHPQAGHAAIDSVMCVTWHIRVCDMTHWLIMWFIHMKGFDLSMWDDIFFSCGTTYWYVTLFIYTCGTFLSLVWLIHMCDMTHSYVWSHSFICVTCLIHICDMTHLHVCHDSFDLTHS